jgi:hypothetical protein
MYACWLSTDPHAGPAAAVSVHTGKFAIGELTAEPANIVRRPIAAHGGHHHAVRPFAEMYGNDPTRFNQGALS